MLRQENVDLRTDVDRLRKGFVSFSCITFGNLIESFFIQYTKIFFRHSQNVYAGAKTTTVLGLLNWGFKNPTKLKTTPQAHADSVMNALAAAVDDPEFPKTMDEFNGSLNARDLYVALAFVRTRHDRAHRNASVRDISVTLDACNADFSLPERDLFSKFMAYPVKQKESSN